MKQARIMAKRNLPPAPLSRSLGLLRGRTAIAAGVSLIVSALLVPGGCLRQEKEANPPAAHRAASPPAPATEGTASSLPLPALSQTPGDVPAAEAPGEPPSVESAASAAEESLPQSTAELIAEVRAVI
ncbi:MAG: hypothetical protein GYA33_05260, partial [Thermogutta sp.]|nr:hypothetical protein [Thermogutta sp.]